MAIKMLTVPRESAPPLYPVVITGEKHMVLVDACFPMQFAALKQAMANEGFAVEDITHIVLTHQDIDHIGCVKEVQEASGAKVIAHEEEAPYIDGRKVPLKLAALEAQFSQLDEGGLQAHRMLSRGFAARRIPIDRTVRHQERLPFGAGSIVIHTPGHTPGHICLYVEEDKALISGDALNLSEGALAGPNPVHTPDMEQATQSLGRLLDFDIQTVYAYHGGRLDGHVREGLKIIIDA
jgi:glyoxylase-like metal-dependent hydrolase (beta-lactamase superfamily II)